MRMYHKTRNSISQAGVVRLIKTSRKEAKAQLWQECQILNWMC